MATRPKRLRRGPRPVHRSRTGAATPESQRPHQDPPDPAPDASDRPPPTPQRDPVSGYQHDAQGDQPSATTTPTPVGVSAADRALMRTRLAAMAAPRETDTPRVGSLRAILRDQKLMAHVTANVEQWPPLTDEQRDTFAALLGGSAVRTARITRHPARRAAHNADRQHGRRTA